MDGFFINLSTELVGILVTVAYVDWILRAHERKRWHGTGERISVRMRTFSNATVTGLRVALGFGTDVLDQSVLRTKDPKLGSAEVMRVAVHLLAPAARARLDHLDASGWEKLAKHLQFTWREAERLLDQFGNRLDPTEVELLLDMQEALETSLLFWRTFPDIAGVPDAELPKTRTDSIQLKAAWSDITAEAIRKVLALADQISRRCGASSGRAN
jgi:hypothetical protein